MWLLKKFLIFYLAFAKLIYIEFAFADEENNIGIICDSNGEPLSYVEIAIYNDKHQTVTITDENGAFKLPPITAYLEKTAIKIRLGDRQPVTFSYFEFREQGYKICLEPEQPSYEEVVVVGRKISMPFASKNINKLEVYTNSSSKSDPILAITSLPSSTNIDGSAEPQFRGTGLGLSQIYLNDVPLYEVVKARR